MNDNSQENDDMPSHLNGDSQDNDDMPPLLNENSQDNDVMPPLLNEDSQDNDDMSPIFNDDSQDNDDMPPILNDDSQDNEDERHSSQMYVDNHNEPQVIRTLKIQRTMKLALSIQPGHGILDQNFCVHQPRTYDTGVHDQRPRS